MKKSLVLAMAMALGVTASAYAANPFSDVPAGHWAYDSIEKLADAGVIDGYGDTTFGGDRLMTRYEMAQIVAKAMARGANVDKLAAEFADELDSLGVRVANLEKKADNVKITGEFRYRYWNTDTKGGATGQGEKQELRSRIWFNGQVNKDWKYTAMLENQQDITNDAGDETTKFQRAYVDGKLGGVKVRAGRYQFTDQFDAAIYDTRFDGISASFGKDVSLKVSYGKYANGTSAGGSKADDGWSAEAKAKIGVVDGMVGYYNFKDCTTGDLAGEDVNLVDVGVKFPIAKDLKLGLAGYFSDYDDNGADDVGYMATLNYKGAKPSKEGSWGIYAKYFYMPTGTYIAPTYEYNNFADFQKNGNNGFEGFMVGANWTIAKNIVATVEYYDLEGIDGSAEADTFYGKLNFTF